MLSLSPKHSTFLLFSIQLKQSAADKLVQCENVKIDWGLNEVRLIWI